MNVNIQKIDPVKATITCEIDLSSLVAVFAAFTQPPPKKETLSEKRIRAKGLLSEAVQSGEGLPSMGELAEAVGASRQSLFCQSSEGGRQLTDYYNKAIAAVATTPKTVPDKSYLK